jgi:hypothetical protein
LRRRLRTLARETVCLPCPDVVLRTRNRRRAETKKIRRRNRRRSGLSETNPRSARLRRKNKSHPSRDPLHRRHGAARGVCSPTGGAEPGVRNRLAVRKRKRKSKPLGWRRTKRKRVGEERQQRPRRRRESRNKKQWNPSASSAVAAHL